MVDLDSGGRQSFAIDDLEAAPRRSGNRAARSNDEREEYGDGYYDRPPQNDYRR